MRRAVAPRSLGRYISTAPLAPAPTRPAAAWPCRRSAPPSSLLSQSRFQSGNSQSKDEDEDVDVESEPRNLEPKLEDEDAYAASEARDLWSKHEQSAFRRRQPWRQRWTMNREDNLAVYDERLLRNEERIVIERAWAPKGPPQPEPNIETYLFSDHVLDLGAENAPGVRDYDEADKEFWNEKWRAPSAEDAAARQRIRSQVESANEAAKAFEHIKSTRDLKYLLIRDPDILSIALRGGPGRPADEEPQPLGAIRRASADVLHRNGIPRVTWGDDPTILWWMESRVATTAPRNVKIPDHANPEFAFRHGRFDFGEFRRILEIALASGKGFRSPTLKLQKQVALLCRNGGPDRPAELSSSYSILAFVMDVERAVRMGTDKLRTPLIRIAIEHSAGGLYVDAAHYYLRMAEDAIAATASEYGRPNVKRLVAEGIARALNRLALNLEAAAKPGRHVADLPSRTSIIRLLTGFGSDWIEAPSFFMRFMGYKDVRMIALQPYVGNLARLGALRSVWLLWKATTRMHYGGLEDRGPQTVDIFSRALVNAKDVIRAYRLEDSKTPNSPGDASLMDCAAMDDDITKRPRSSLANIADVEVSPEIPFQVTAALEMETPEEAIRMLKEAICEEAAEEDEEEEPEDSEAADSWDALQRSSRKQDDGV